VPLSNDHKGRLGCCLPPDEPQEFGSSSVALLDTLVGTQQHARRNDVLHISPGIFVYVIIITCKYYVHLYSSFLHWYFGQTAHSFQVCLHPVVAAFLVLKLVFFLPCLPSAFLNTWLTSLMLLLSCSVASNCSKW